MRTTATLSRGRLLTTMLVAALAGLLAALALAPAAEARHDGKNRSTRHVLWVGNNWGGTVDVVYPRGKFRHVTRINIIPDKAERELATASDPVQLGFFLGIRAAVGEGHDQYADDMYTSKDGRILAISRPSFRDVVGFDLTDCEVRPADQQAGEPTTERCKMLWRFQVDGARSDHMAVSPDGKNLAVSASTGNVVHILNIRTGEEVGVFDSGDSPHENIYSEDGELLYHASIGRVYTPNQQSEPELDSSKGERIFTVVDTETNEHLPGYPIDMGDKLREAGYYGMSSAVRPMTHSPNERFVYLQVSFFHGFVEYDLKKDRVRRVANLPLSEEAANTPQEQYLLNSAHHGIAMNGNGNRLCVAGTMSDYAAIVSRKTFRYRLIKAGKKPYWSTVNHNGRKCFVSWSGTDRVSVISFAKKKEIGRIPVGFHPQRVRISNARVDWLRERNRNR